MFTSLESVSDIQHALRAELGRPVAYQPTTSGITLGSGGTLNAAYAVVGQLCFFWLDVEFGTGLSVGDFRFTWPPPDPWDDFTLDVPFGFAALVDVGNTVYVGAVRRQGAGTFQVVRLNAATGNWEPLGSTNPFTWAAGDRIRLQGWYLIDPDWTP